VEDARFRLSLVVSRPEKLKPEDGAKTKPPIVRSETKDDDARAIELILKYGLQRLLNPKR